MKKALLTLIERAKSLAQHYKKKYKNIMAGIARSIFNADRI
jgi:hypothetical protein